MPDQNVTLVYEKDELLLLANAFNELTNGIRWTDLELERSAGCSAAKVREIHESISDLYDLLFLGGASTAALRNHRWQPQWRTATAALAVGASEIVCMAAAVREVLSGRHIPLAAFHARLGVDEEVASRLLSRFDAAIRFSRSDH